MTIDEFIAKSFKLNTDNTSYANLLMILLQQGSICQTRPFLPKMDAEDNMEEEIMINGDLDATTLEGICVVDEDFFESPGKNSREAIVGLHLGLG